MKTNFLTSALPVVAALLIGVAGCNVPAKETATQTGQTAALTPERKQAIEQEITGLTTGFFQHVERLDIERCMTFFANTPDFLAVNPDGTLGDYAALKKLNADGFAQMKTFRVRRTKEATRVLSDSLVLYTWTAAQTGTLKTGPTISYANVAGTMLFTRVGGAWKATFYHESALPPVVSK